MSTRTNDAPPAAIRELGTVAPPHDFDGIQAKGDWVVAEQVATQEKTAGGIIVPDAAQMPIWMVISIGEKVVGIGEGERVLFVNPPANFTHDNRRFALLKAEHIVATLPMPDPARNKRIIVPGIDPREGDPRLS